MKNYSLIFLLITSLLVSCISKSDGSVSNISESEIQLSEFQKDSIEGMQWIKKIHDSINEPNLNDLDYECYRFNYLDAFGKNKLFRIEHFSDNHNRLVIKSYNKEKNYEDEIYSLASESTIDLTFEQYNEFKKLVDGSYFWSLKMIEYPKPQYLDGHGYLLEGFEPESGSKKQRYHVVARTVPHEGSFKQACENLMEFYNQETQQ